MHEHVAVDEPPPGTACSVSALKLASMPEWKIICHSRVYEITLCQRQLVSWSFFMCHLIFLSVHGSVLERPVRTPAVGGEPWGKRCRPRRDRKSKTWFKQTCRDRSVTLIEKQEGEADTSGCPSLKNLTHKHTNRGFIIKEQLCSSWHPPLCMHKNFLSSYTPGLTFQDHYRYEQPFTCLSALALRLVEGVNKWKCWTWLF